jgi:hypothetical protein
MGDAWCVRGTGIASWSCLGSCWRNTPLATAWPSPTPRRTGFPAVPLRRSGPFGAQPTWLNNTRPRPSALSLTQPTPHCLGEGSPSSRGGSQSAATSKTPGSRGDCGSTWLWPCCRRRESERPGKPAARRRGSSSKQATVGSSTSVITFRHGSSTGWAISVRPARRAAASTSRVARSGTSTRPLADSTSGPKPPGGESPRRWCGTSWSGPAPIRSARWGFARPRPCVFSETAARKRP